MPQAIEQTPSAYGYPLLIKQLLHSALATAPEQEIIYGARRLTYAGFFTSACSAWPMCSRKWACRPAIRWR